MYRAPIALALCLFGTLALAKGPHHTPAGFFDIHVCNRPESSHIIMALFSTEQFDDLEKVTVFTPGGTALGALDMEKFRSFKTAAGKHKRAFITYFQVPTENQNGWYRAEISLKDGRKYEARDYVIDATLPMAAGLSPAPDAENVEMPTELRWDPVPGATHYQIYLHDKWLEQPILTSRILDAPVFKVPPGLLQPGGLYSWSVHARDVNEHVLLGDFNHGATTPQYTFSIKD